MQNQYCYYGFLNVSSPTNLTLISNFYCRECPYSTYIPLISAASRNTSNSKCVSCTYGCSKCYEGNSTHDFTKILLDSPDKINADFKNTILPKSNNRKFEICTNCSNSYYLNLKSKKCVSCPCVKCKENSTGDVGICLECGKSKKSDLQNIEIHFLWLLYIRYDKPKSIISESNFYSKKFNFYGNAVSILDKTATFCKNCPYSNLKCTDEYKGNSNNTPMYKVVQSSYSLSAIHCISPFVYDYEKKRCKICSLKYEPNNSPVRCTVRKKYNIIYDCSGKLKSIENAENTILVAKSFTEIQTHFDAMLTVQSVLALSLFGVEELDIGILFNKLQVCIQDSVLTLSNSITKDLVPTIDKVSLNISIDSADPSIFKFYFIFIFLILIYPYFDLIDFLDFII